MAIKLRLFDTVETTDEKMSVRQFGFVIERPNDVRGDSVNVVAVGGRFDTVSEFMESRKQAAAASVKKEAKAKDTDPVSAAYEAPAKETSEAEAEPEAAAA